MVLATIRFRVLPHKREEGMSAFDALAQRMRVAAGCTSSRVLTDTDDNFAFTVTAEWKDRSDADGFFNSREFQLFRGVRILLRDEPYIVLDEVQNRMTRMMRS
jgi:quinol monooxygenase YgiN